MFLLKFSKLFVIKTTNDKKIKEKKANKMLLYNTLSINLYITNKRNGNKNNKNFIIQIMCEFYKIIFNKMICIKI